MTGASLGGLTQAAAPTQAGVNQVDVEEKSWVSRIQGALSVAKR
jgi:hypothetical protein